jgi:hypothetical protein
VDPGSGRRMLCLDLIATAPHLFIYIELVGKNICGKQQIGIDIDARV